MNNPLYPDCRYARITDLPPNFLVSRGIRGAILDVDNTLTTHDNPRPADGVLDWLQKARDAGLSLVILSNNSPERVAPFAAMLGLEFEADGKKPLPSGVLRACKHLGTAPHETALIGDQLFTDILGGRVAGLFCCLVDPIELESGAFFRLKRALERPILRSFTASKKASEKAWCKASDKAAEKTSSKTSGKASAKPQKRSR